jgi:hypothetical protein
MSDPFRRPSRLTLACGLLGAVLAGCSGYSPGGFGQSGEAETYDSTPDFPQTLTLVDQTTHEAIWTADIPVGKQLVLRFEDDFNPKSTARPALMHWEIMERGATSGALTNSVPAPPAYGRLIEVTYRKQANAARKGAVTPPPSMPPPPAPAATPAPVPQAPPPAPSGPTPASNEPPKPQG